MAETEKLNQTEMEEKVSGRVQSTASDDTGSITMVRVEEEGGRTRRKTSGTSRSKRKLCIAFGVLLIIAVIVAAVLLGLFLSVNKKKSPLYRYSFDDMFGKKFTAKKYSLQWISDTEYLHKIEGDLYITDLIGDSKIILPKAIMESLNGSSYKISPDHKYLLIASNVKKLYRYSFYAEYYIYEIEQNVTTKLKPSIDEPIRYAGWSTVDNALVYVFRNDIYWRKTAIGTDFRITTNGEEPTSTDNDQDRPYYNGIPDWVYEEEIFGKDNTLWFSEDGNYLCFASFNEVDVPYFRWPIYDDITDSYGKMNKITYPKAGKTNPTVYVHVFNLKNMQNDGRTPKRMSPPAEVQNSDYYVSQVSWVDNTRVNIQWLNRLQTKTVVARYTAYSGLEEHKYVHNMRNGWVYEKYPEGYYPKDEDFYITIMPMLENNEHGYFLHLVRIPLQADRPSDVESITTGQYEVMKFWYNEKNQVVYYISNEQGPSQRHLYRIGVYGLDKECLTCEEPVYTSGQCKYFDAAFSTECSFYVLYCLGPGIPQTTLHSTEKTEVTYLEKNTELQDTIRKTDMPIIRNFTIRVEEKVDIHARMILPPTFDDEEEERYPVLFYIYGGPGSQKVTDVYQMSFSSYLVSNFDIIVVEVDGRGTGFKGEKFKHYVYQRLGEYEAADVITVGRYMQKKPYVNPSKLAVWGWSYGGYLTSYILGNKTDVFKCGMAVAPVADWRYYDSIYTERYMGLPTKDGNLEGYQRSSVLPYCKNFRNDSYLLVHGTGDDNVHFQNAAQLVRELVKAHISFRVQFYTDKTHGLYGDATRRHLYWLLSSFLQDCLTF